MKLFTNIFNPLELTRKGSSSRRSNATAAIHLRQGYDGLISNLRLPAFLQVRSTADRLRSVLPSQRRKGLIYYLTIFFILIPSLLFSQLGVSGNITPNVMLRISDGSLINLPFRLGDLSLNYAHGDFELVTNMALETRWKDAEFSTDMLQLREAYLSWYPAFGEVRLGKMIHAWGAADANNPTDNLSPYDFYYMFLAGTDRKLGSFNANTKIYLGDFLLDLVVIPEFVENRIPYNEPDFPIKIELPQNAEVIEPKDVVEFGGRLQYAMGLGDVSLSYFRGYDRSISPIGVRIGEGTAGTMITIHPQLGYRETSVYGADFVLFPGNWTVRGELGYFQTETPELDLDISKLMTETAYLQYILQVEYSFANGVQLMGQFLNTDYGEISTTFTPHSSFTSLPNPIQTGIQSMLTGAEFQAGMGTPFGMIADKVAIVSSMVELFDNSLELRGMFMINLDETGYMINTGGSYVLLEGLSMDAAVGYFIGGDEVGNSFRELEDFSNLSLGLTYSF